MARGQTNRSLLTLLSLLLLLLAAPVAPALAQIAPPATAPAPDFPVQLRGSQAEVDFPNEIRFSLDATATRRVERVALYWRTGDNPVLSYRYPQVVPGLSVRTTYTWRVRDVLLPGTLIDYFWELEDAQGNVFRSPRQEVQYQDLRFAWRQVEQGRVAVYWYSNDQTVGPELLRQAVPILEELTGTFQVQLDKPVRIYAYARREDFQSAMGSRTNPGLVGLASGSDRVYVFAQPTTQGVQQAVDFLRHELTHLVVDQATENPYAEPPRWLNEGLASYLMRDPNELRQLENALAQGLRQNTLISLRSLGSQFPSDDRGIALAYAESYSVVTYIVERYGGRAMGQLLGAFKAGALPDDALQQVLGVDTEKLEADWHAHLRGAGQGQGSPSSGQPVAVPTGLWERSTQYWVGFFERYGLVVAGVLAGLLGALVVASVVLTVVSRRNGSEG
jgi:hypothetical protein